MGKRSNWNTKLSDDLALSCKIIVAHINKCRNNDNLVNSNKISSEIKKLDEASEIFQRQIKKLNKLLIHISGIDNIKLKTIRHDLFNAVNVIKGYSEIIIEELNKNEEDKFVKSLLVIVEQIKNISMALMNDNLQELIETHAGTQINVESFQSSPMSITGRILVVDDDELSRSLMHDWLTAKGHVVVSKSTGREALQLLKHQNKNFDLVLLDMMMPIMSGYEVLKQIKTSQEYKSVSVIMLTAVYDIENIMQCIKSGAEDYVLKPFNSYLLDLRIKISLERKQLEKFQKESKEQLNLITNSLPVLICAFDNDLKFTFNNYAYEVWFNKPVASLKGKSLGELFPKEACDVIYENYKKMLIDKKHVTFELAIELPILDRRLHFLSVTLTPHISDSAVKLTFASMNDITHLKKAEERLQYMATHDGLTGLPNRNLLDIFLAESMAYADDTHSEMAVCFLDIDRFKLINDTLGHHYGDLLLIEVAKRLKRNLRENDIIVRMGGDEFVVIFRDIHAVETIRSVAKKLCRSIEKLFLIEGQELTVTLSIGISRYPTDASDKQTLLKFADLALYYVKDHYRNNFQFYAHDLNTKAASKMLMTTELHRAIHNNEFVIYYQPIVDVKSKKIKSLEALIRWEHPDKGLLLPDEFLPMAEESGIIIELENWVFDKVCKQNIILDEEHHKIDIITINISPSNLYRSDFIAKIKRLLLQQKVDPKHLIFELTENSLIKDFEGCLVKINQLKRMGIKVFIDDFGVGYLNLDYLGKMPIDGIKINKSFVQAIHKNKNNDAIISTIISLAHRLNLIVIAEGVETEEQLHFLKDLDCDLFQGILYAEPRDQLDFP